MFQVYICTNKRRMFTLCIINLKFICHIHSYIDIQPVAKCIWYRVPGQPSTRRLPEKSNTANKRKVRLKKNNPQTMLLWENSSNWKECGYSSHQSWFLLIIRSNWTSNVQVCTRDNYSALTVNVYRTVKLWDQPGTCYVCWLQEVQLVLVRIMPGFCV